jgi:hypothetical protein
MLTDNIPQLAIENNEDGTITLEQDWSGNVDRVTVHPLHLRFMAERLGLVREMSASEADALRTVAALKRRLLVLQKRINHLGEYLALHSDSEHADLTYEQGYATATADIADEFCADLDQLAPCNAMERHVTPSHASVTRDIAGTADAETQTKPTGNPAVTHGQPSANPAGSAAQLELEA